jgi:hypothetical protein
MNCKPECQLWFFNPKECEQCKENKRDPANTDIPYRGHPPPPTYESDPIEFFKGR